MKPISTLLALALAALAVPAQAQFSGPYAPANWPTATTGTLAGTGTSAGSASFSSSLLTLVGGNGIAPAGSDASCVGGTYAFAGPCQIQTTIGVPGTYSFHWSYLTADDCRSRWRHLRRARQRRADLSLRSRRLDLAKRRSHVHGVVELRLVPQLHRLHRWHGHRDDHELHGGAGDSRTVDLCADGSRPGGAGRDFTSSSRRSHGFARLIEAGFGQRRRFDAAARTAGTGARRARRRPCADGFRAGALGRDVSHFP